MYHNSRATPSEPYGERKQSIVSRRAFSGARHLIADWPGYSPTPLVALRGLAADAGVDRIWYKDERARFGLGSFKALGGAYAL